MTAPSTTAARYFYVVDGRGNVVALTSSAGAVVDRYTYDLWGAPTSVSEAVPQPYRYAGYWYDKELGWYWVSVRHYDPALKQITDGSCVSACGAMLSHDIVTEEELLAELGDWADPRDLAGALDARNIGGGGWRSEYFLDGANAVAAAERGPMGAVLQVFGRKGHMVFD